jgi:hypothetical protein
MNNVKQLAYAAGVVALAFGFILFGTPASVQAQTTVPVMVDYFDTENAGVLNPNGIAYISSGPLAGNYAMVDDIEDKVFILDEDGILQDEFDVTPLPSTNPTGITYITSGPQAGNFAITDATQDEVFIVNTSGAKQDQFDTLILGSNNPTGIGFISSGAFSGDLAIVDSSQDEVFIVSINGLSVNGQFDTADFTSVNPQGITFAASGKYAGNLAILDGSQLQVFVTDTNGILQDDFDTAFVSPASKGITFHSGTGNFGVVDDTSDEVFGLNADGDLFDTFSTNLFNSTDPRGITYITSGSLADKYAIVDAVSDSVYFVDPDGNLDSSCTLPAGNNDPRGIAFIPSDENFAVIDAGDDAIFIIDKTCTLQELFNLGTFGIFNFNANPSGIDYGRDYLPNGDNFVIVDSTIDSAVVVNLSQPSRIRDQRSTAALGAASPVGFVLLPDTGTAAVVDSGDDEVYIANANGVLQARFDIAPVSLSPSGIAFDSTDNVFAILDNGDDEVSFLNLPSLVESIDACECDLNTDGRCDGRDWLLFFPDWGRSDCPVIR